MVQQFGEDFSLADQLRFPVFLQSLTAADDLRAIVANLPKRTRDLVSRYESGLDQAVLDDLRYDYRIRLVPIVGSKTDADLAASFVKLEDLTEQSRTRGPTPWLRHGRSRTLLPTGS